MIDGMYLDTMKMPFTAVDSTIVFYWQIVWENPLSSLVANRYYYTLHEFPM